MTIALITAQARPIVEGRLPPGIEPLWWETPEQLVDLAPQAEIGWFDMFDKSAPLEAIRRATGLKYLNSFFAGVDWLPLADLQARGVKLTNGSGINANTVAEFALMNMLALARGHADIVRAQDRHEWLAPSMDGKARELAGAKVLIIGYGEIGQAIGRMLAGFRAEVTPVRRSGADGALGPDEWQARVGEFEWVVLAMPGTPETRGLVDARVLAAMRSDAVLVNMGRADVLDQDALIAALHAGKLAGAILDLTDPEPLPSGHPLWSAPGAHITMHMGGLPTLASRIAAAERFIANCGHYLRGEPLVSEVDLALGY
ncbi:D-2-hydroxyacid dehydrogenase [Altererythrobacter sp. KTW20L]|uniref:D-2-hydroxyacid dehydrogenase n=1 Tax=Altererythrobacter sp. KTW20L TaxID=2942210 RepID=UPI0020BD71C7|nr:D-2-hydroxyacid dehydrogenase [Altererythrobacter sp. KTW20L]MCL6249513.1 D-2-hydroxyacid dehydrogenase [Altererythrobacter sp. KTW20L]